MGRKKKLTPRASVLTQALDDVEDRNGIYGDAKVCHMRIAHLCKAWNEIKADGGEVTPLDIVVYHILTNLARIAETPNHKGAWENIAGYAGVGYEVAS